MMHQIIIFGYDEYAKEIALAFKNTQTLIQIYLFDEFSCKQAIDDGYTADLVELDDDWLDIKKKFNVHSLMCFCALADDAKNVFLTLSLRAQYPLLHIVSLATSEQSAQKLRLAGATKAIAKLETTAHIIVESLERPIAVKVLNEIIYEKNGLSMQEFTILKDSALCEKDFSELLELSEDYEIIILTLYDKEKNMHFTYSNEVESLKLLEGSVLVIMGKDKDIQNFQKEVL
ncbi:NAD-binding protein [Sulfurimonas sp. MAG313]|nr:NAD-binding protein [Sulfurimonas sp. MAG313]MDF1879972.1 NAD-binding protein [Sulfurimonas sp. MAG313]